MTEVIERTANPFGQTGAAKSQGALVSTEQQRAIAEVQAALVMARAAPRDPKIAMDSILEECTRLTLAEQATYVYGRGGEEVSGPSIRLAETIARRWTNIECGVKELSRRDGVSECMAYAWDLESNFRDVKTFSVRHWRDTKTGGYALREERDIYELTANMGSRRKRACILTIVPGDVIEAAVAQCDATLAKIGLDEDSIALMLEKFAGFGVSRALLEKRVQRRLDTIKPSQFVKLRGIFNSLRDGMSTPSDWFDVPATRAASEPEAPAEGTKTDAIKARMRGRAEPAEPADPLAPADTGDTPRTHPGDPGEGASFAQVTECAQALREAATVEVLDAEADLIRHVEPAERRDELTALYRQRRAELENPASAEPPPPPARGRGRRS